MAGERPGPTQEAEQSLTPRQKLEAFLKGEKPYSTKNKAVSDMLALEKAWIRLLTQPLFYESNLPALRVVQETIRTREFDEKGAEYHEAFLESKKMFDQHANIKQIIKFPEVTAETVGKPGKYEIEGSEFRQALVHKFETALRTINENKSRATR